MGSRGDREVVYLEKAPSISLSLYYYKLPNTLLGIAVRLIKTNKQKYTHDFKICRRPLEIISCPVRALLSTLLWLGNLFCFACCDFNVLEEIKLINQCEEHTGGRIDCGGPGDSVLVVWDRCIASWNVWGLFNIDKFLKLQSF